MKRFIGKFMAVGVAATGLSVAGPVLAAQAWESVGLKTQYPSSGGVWQYGFENLMLRSYYTVNKCHGSTVQKLENGSVVKTSRSVDTAAGKRSIAEIGTINYASMDGRYYYRTC